MDLSRELRRLIADTRVRRRAVAEELGLGVDVVYKAISGARPPSPEQAAAIRDAVARIVARREALKVAQATASARAMLAAVGIEHDPEPTEACGA